MVSRFPARSRASMTWGRYWAALTRLMFQAPWSWSSRNIFARRETVTSAPKLPRLMVSFWWAQRVLDYLAEI